MGEISLKEHGPHVDSRDRPDKAKVSVRLTIPSLNKQVVLERTVKDPNRPKITPSDPEALKVLSYIARHPEFALSRREIIKYVISIPGDRSSEIQELLKLSSVGQLRAVLQRIANSKERELVPLERERSITRDRLLEALQISDLTAKSILEAVNARRALLGLAPIETLTATISLRDGLDTTTPHAEAQRVSKTQAAEATQQLTAILDNLSNSEIKAQCDDIIRQLSDLVGSPIVANRVRRQELLNLALSLVEGEYCPVCDTSWKPDELKQKIEDKLRLLDSIVTKRKELESRIAPITRLLSNVTSLVESVEHHGTGFKPVQNLPQLSKFRRQLAQSISALSDFVPVERAIEALKEVQIVPPEIRIEIEEFTKLLSRVPEPSKQDISRDYLTLGQERLSQTRA